MSLTARVPAGLDTAGFIPEIWTQEVIDAMKMQLVAWPAIDAGEWTAGLKKGDTFYFGITNHVTATEVTVGTKAAALDPATGTKVTLSIDQFWEAPIDVDVMSGWQSQVELAETARDESAYAIAKKMDSTVCALFSSLGGYSTSGYGSDGQTLTDDILTAIIELLNEADVPMDGNRNLILDPSAVTDLLKIDKFIAAQYVNIGAVTNGMIGRTPIYGCNVRVTNNLAAATTGSYACLLHKKAIKGMSQMNIAWVKKFEELHNVRYQAEALWGVVEARDGFGVPFFTRHA
jgi:hypothetical protein